MTQRFTQLFPLWVAGAAALTFVEPRIFTWFTGPWITWGLAFIMLGMGITLTVDDFRRVTRIPYQVFLGTFLHFTVMPALGWSAAKLFGLDDPFAVGIILVACCPCGTASNVINYLAKSDVPLAVTITAVSTLAAVIMTPLLTGALAGSRMNVDGAGLLISTGQVILAPVTLGILIKRFAPAAADRILPFSPPAAVVIIVMIVASVLGSNRDAIVAAGLRLLAAVVFLHGGGFLIGYLLARIFLNKTASRTISVEVGMQNSGLAVVLARANFANPLVAVPGAISSFVHSAIGSILAAFWRRSSIIQENSFENPDHAH